MESQVTGLFPLGISKQAAHKLAGATITTLREKLDSMGFHGLDTMGS